MSDNDSTERDDQPKKRRGKAVGWLLAAIALLVMGGAVAWDLASPKTESAGSDRMASSFSGAAPSQASLPALVDNAQSVITQAESMLQAREQARAQASSPSSALDASSPASTAALDSGPSDAALNTLIADSKRLIRDAQREIERRQAATGFSPSGGGNASMMGSEALDSLGNRLTNQQQSLSRNTPSTTGTRSNQGSGESNSLVPEQLNDALSSLAPSGNGSGPSSSGSPFGTGGAASGAVDRLEGMIDDTRSSIGSGLGTGGDTAAPETVFRLGFGFAAGFVGLFALKKLFKLTVLFAGLVMLMLMGLQHASLIEIQWGAWADQYESARDWAGGQFASVSAFVQGAVPVTATAMAGAAAGWRAG